MNVSHACERLRHKRAVFLDRDGVLNLPVVRGDRVTSPFSLDEFRFTDHAAYAVQMVQSVGYMTFVVTNQPYVATGEMSIEALREIMEHVRSSLLIDDYSTALQRESPWYKPGPRMITDLAADNQVWLEGSWMIGDMWRDVVAGKRAGCRTIFIGERYECPPELVHYQPDFVCDDVLDACIKVIENDE